MAGTERGWNERMGGGRQSAGHPRDRRADITFVRAVERFWRHGDFFSAAAISFYAMFSLLPLAILLLVSLQFVFPANADAISRNMGRLFGGLNDANILLRTIRAAYEGHGRLGWF